MVLFVVWGLYGYFCLKFNVLLSERFSRCLVLKWPSLISIAVNVRSDFICVRIVCIFLLQIQCIDVGICFKMGGTEIGITYQFVGNVGKGFICTSIMCMSYFEYFFCFKFNVLILASLCDLNVMKDTYFVLL